MSVTFGACCEMLWKVNCGALLVNICKMQKVQNRVKFLNLNKVKKNRQCQTLTFYGAVIHPAAKHVTYRQEIRQAWSKSWSDNNNNNLAQRKQRRLILLRLSWCRRPSLQSGPAVRRRWLVLHRQSSLVICAGPCSVVGMPLHIMQHIHGKQGWVAHHSNKWINNNLLHKYNSFVSSNNKADQENYEYEKVKLI